MPQKFVNLENLTSFWSNAKEYIDNERKEIEDQFYNWQKTKKAPIVQCEPVPNSDLHSVVDFTFTETPPAEGEKSPSNPSTITGVSSVKVTKCGKNLLALPYYTSSSTINGITWTVRDDGTIIANGTCSSSHSNFYVAYQKKIPKGTYTFSVEGGISGISEGALLLPSGTIYGAFTPKTFTIDEQTLIICRLRVVTNATVSNYEFHPLLELGNSSTSFENELGTDYIINLGDIYYGGSIDMNTGIMTVTYTKYIFSDSTNISNITEQSNGLYTFAFVWNTQIQDIQTANSTYYCSHFPNTTDYRSGIDGSHFSLYRFYIDSTVYTTEADFKAWLASEYAAGHPVTLVYKIQNPFIVQLTSQQIKSLTSLEGTSKRINTIYTDADSIQVEYQKYVGIDSTLDSDSVNAIQNKVVNSALNTKVSLTGDETINGTKTFFNTINGSITGDAGTVAGHIVSKDVPINAAFTDTTYEPATQSTAGLMSASDKIKLDAVGSVFSFKGSVVNSSSLPASDNVNGDAYLAEDTGHVHVYDGTNFVDIGVWAGIPSATDAQIDALFED